MTDTTSKNGNFQVSNTPELRALFARTHDVMSGPGVSQYSPSEQYEMYLLCRVGVVGNRRQLDVQKTEENILELIEFLNENGVAIRDIIPKIRCFEARTKGLARRRRIWEHRQSQGQSQGLTALVFQAPQFATA